MAIGAGDADRPIEVIHVSDMTPHERLRQAREARADAIDTIARRSGVRAPLLRAIDAGRFADLPHGVYGRAAIRAYAAAVGLPPDEIVAACDPLLPPLDDPIAALCRLRGIRRPSAAMRPFPQPANAASIGGSRNRSASAPPRAPAPATSTWRLAAAAALDALVVVALLVGVVAITVAAFGGPVSALGPTAAPAFAATALILWMCYVVLFGGIAGSTPGERALGVDTAPRASGPVDLRGVACRAVRYACRDVWAIELLGGWIGGLAVAHWPLLRSGPVGRTREC